MAFFGPSSELVHQSSSLFIIPSPSPSLPNALHFFLFIYCSLISKLINILHSQVEQSDISKIKTWTPPLPTYLPQCPIYPLPSFLSSTLPSFSYFLPQYHIYPLFSFFSSYPPFLLSKLKSFLSSYLHSFPRSLLHPTSSSTAWRRKL